MGTRVSDVSLPCPFAAAYRAELLGSTYLSPVSDVRIMARMQRVRLVGSAEHETTGAACDQTP